MRQLLRVQMFELVSHLHDRMTGEGKNGKPKVFRQTMTENFKDFLNVFESRNLTDDDDLKTYVRQARQLLDGVDADSLRRSAALRAEVGESFGAMKTQLAQMLTDRPSRAISLAEDGEDD